MRGARLVELMRTPWALEPRAFEIMRGVVDRWARGEGASLDVLGRVHADSEDRQRRRASIASQAGAVQVIPIHGVLTQRGNMIDEISGPGSTSTEMLTQALREAVADDSVASILLDVDSPGGSVYGVSELADEIYQARSKKPVIAVANSLAASAAYWLASSATEFYITPGGEAGSIGVIMTHTDFSRANDMAGVKVTYITAGKYKSEGNADEPLSAEAQAYEQGRIDDYYSAFTRAVARGRGVSVATVRGASYGEGRVLGAKDAVAAGMADGVRTFDDALARARQLAKGPTTPRGATRSDPARAQQAHMRARIRLAEQS